MGSWVVVIIVIVVIVAMTGSGLAMGKRKNKKNNNKANSNYSSNQNNYQKTTYGNSSNSSQNYFETQKTIWYTNIDKNIDLGNHVYEQINEFPFFSDFRNTKRYLNDSHISFRKMGEAENLLNNLNKNFRDIFDEYEAMLISNFNELGIVMNPGTMQFLTNHYLDFLDSSYLMTLNMLYGRSAKNIIDYAFDQKDRTDLYQNNQLKQQYQNNLANLVNETISNIYDQLNGTYGYSNQNDYSNEDFNDDYYQQEQSEDSDYSSFYSSASKDELTIAYETLEIDDSMSDEEIKKAYKKLALKYHPDRNKTQEAKQKMVEINAAYTLIKKVRNM